MNTNYRKGIISIIISAMGFASMSFFVKMAVGVPVMQKTLFRNLVAGTIAFLLLKRSGIKFEIGKGNRFTMLCRCAVGTVGLVCNFWALSYLSMGDAGILQKMAPFFAILMSIFILNEKPNKMEILCLIAAIFGAVLVVKPTRGVASFPALIGLAGGFAAGTAYTYVRKLGLRGVKGPVTVFCFSAFSSIVLLPSAIMSWQPMSLRQIIFLSLAGTGAAVGQFFVTAAYTYAPAKDISIFDYTQVLFAALLGFVFLREIPDALSLAGYIIIIGAALAKWYLGRKG